MSTCFDFNYLCVYISRYQFLLIIGKVNLVKHKLSWIKT